VYCKAFEDNSGALELAKAQRMTPRSKHINIVYHHFREHVRDGTIQLYAISTINQLADICTKPLAQNIFLPLRKAIMGWDSATSPTLA
jgi:hypothetical protein